MAAVYPVMNDIETVSYTHLSAFGSVPAGWAAISLYGKGTEIRSLPGGRPGTGTLIF